MKHSSISASPAPTVSVPLVSVFCLRVPTQTRLWRLLRLFALRVPAFQLVILCFVCFQITTPGAQWIPGACKCKGCVWDSFVVVVVVVGFLGELDSQACISIQLLLSPKGRENQEYFLTLHGKQRKPESFKACHHNKPGKVHDFQGSRTQRVKESWVGRRFCTEPAL